MTATQTWINVLPKHVWTSFCSPSGEVLEVFRLDNYSIENGAIKLDFKTKKTFVITGLKEANLGSGLYARIYIPVELHQVPGIGLSPKMVYTFPRGCRIEEYRAEPYVSPEERMYQKARTHNVVELKLTLNKG